MENRAAKLQLLTKLKGICQISVMCQRHSALDVVYNHGLSVDPVRRSGRAVTYMPDGYLALAELFHNAGSENIVYKPRVPYKN